MGKEKDVVSSKFKVQLRVHSQETSTIVRLVEDLPMITDKTDKAVLWLVAKGFKADEIEVIGEKPKNWNEAFEVVVPT